MKDIEKKYMNEKEAAYRYGYSVSWFQRTRHFGDGPKFIKINGSGRVLYPIKETDEWFASFPLHEKCDD